MSSQPFLQEDINRLGAFPAFLEHACEADQISCIMVSSLELGAFYKYHQDTSNPGTTLTDSMKRFNAMDYTERRLYLPEDVHDWFDQLGLSDLITPVNLKIEYPPKIPDSEINLAREVRFHVYV